jgi:phospholipid/cholesterol/gamma-HCH transport system substrate-binding protein
MNARSIATIALVVVAVTAVVVLVGGSGGDRYVVRAEMANASGLRTDAAVKISGVTAGTIADVEVTPRDTAIFTIELDEGAGPIGRGARLRARPSDLLGERYADLSPGDASQPQPSGSMIPLSRASASTDLDEVLDMLDADTRTRVGILVNEMGIGLSGNGKHLAELLRGLPSSLEESQELLAGVAAENVRLRRLISEGARVAASVEGRRDRLGALVDSAAAGLHAIADARTQLGTTIDQAPGGLEALRETLGRLRTASVSLRPAADQLSRVAAPLTTTLRDIKPFADSASGTLKEARRVAPSLKRLGDRATPHVRRLAPTSRRLRRILTDAVPSIKQIDHRAMKDLLWFIQNWARALKGRDNLGHFLGGKMSITIDQLEQLLDGYLVPAATGKSKPRRPEPARKRPSLPAVVNKVVPKVSGKGVDLPPVVTKAADIVNQIVTGVTDKLLPKRAGGGAQQPPPENAASGLLDFLLKP